MFRRYCLWTLISPLLLSQLLASEFAVPWKAGISSTSGKHVFYTEDSPFLPGFPLSYYYERARFCAYASWPEGDSISTFPDNQEKLLYELSESKKRASLSFRFSHPLIFDKYEDGSAVMFVIRPSIQVQVPDLGTSASDVSVTIQLKSEGRELSYSDSPGIVYSPEAPGSDMTITPAMDVVRREFTSDGIVFRLSDESREPTLGVVGRGSNPQKWDHATITIECHDGQIPAGAQFSFSFAGAAGSKVPDVPELPSLPYRIMSIPASQPYLVVPTDFTEGALQRFSAHSSPEYSASNRSMSIQWFDAVPSVGQLLLSYPAEQLTINRQFYAATRQINIIRFAEFLPTSFDQLLQSSWMRVEGLQALQPFSYDAASPGRYLAVEDSTALSSKGWESNIAKPWSVDDGGKRVIPKHLNAHRAIVGAFSAAEEEGSGGTAFPVVWRQGDRPEVLSINDEELAGSAQSINNSSEVVGHVIIQGKQFPAHWFSTPMIFESATHFRRNGDTAPGHLMSVPPFTVSGTAVDVDASGRIIGNCAIHTEELLRACLWMDHNAPAQILPIPDGAVNSRAFALNDIGFIVGMIEFPLNKTMGAMWRIDDPSGQPKLLFEGTATGINNHLQIVGVSRQQAILHHSGFSFPLQDFVSPDKAAVGTPFDINDLGEVFTSVSTGITPVRLQIPRSSSR